LPEAALVAPELGAAVMVAPALSDSIAVSRAAMLLWNSVGMAVSHVGGVGAPRAESMISGRLPVTPAALAALWTAAPRGIKMLDGM
jgi:hypothetical protein